MADAKFIDREEKVKGFGGEWMKCRLERYLNI